MDQNCHFALVDFAQIFQVILIATKFLTLINASILSILRSILINIESFNIGTLNAVRKDSDVPPIMVRSSAEVYDTQTKKWELIIGMWQLDVPPNQIVDVGGRLFSSGDCFKQWKGHIESYDGELNIWNEVDGSHLHSLNALISSDNEMWSHSQRRCYLTMAPIGNHLYFLAIHGLMDSGMSRTMSIVHKYDTSATSNAWTSMEPMEEDREKELCGHACVVHLS